MPGGELTASVKDESLSSLTAALDAAAMRPRLAAALGVDVLECAVDVLAHKPGSRATLRYHVRTSRGAQCLIGKLYRTAELAAEGYRRLAALHEAFAAYGDTRVPPPEAIVPELALVFQRYVEGRDLRHPLAERQGTRPLELAAAFLARLHALQPLDGLTTLSIAHELDKASQWSAQTGAALPELAKSLHNTLAALRAQGETIALPAPSMIHKDFYYAQVLWDGACVWAVDLDELQLGDPALDVGHFVAHLANLSYRQTGRAEAYAGPSAAFIDRYVAQAPDVRDRVPFYLAYTFIKLAATDVARQRGDWRARASVLSGLARDAAERG